MCVLWVEISKNYFEHDFTISYKSFFGLGEGVENVLKFQENCRRGGHILRLDGLILLVQELRRKNVIFELKNPRALSDLGQKLVEKIEAER